MPELVRLVIISNLAQAAAALLLGALLLSFHREDGRPYVRHWALSWLAFTVYLAASAAALSLIRDMAATHPVRLALTLVSLFGAYLQVGWLLAGAWEMRSERGVSPRRMRWLLPAAAVVALACTVAFLFTREAFSERHFVRVGVRAAALGSALLAGAWMVWPGREGEGRTGRRMVAVGFALFAGQQGLYFTIALGGLWGRNPPAAAAHLGTVDFLLQWVIGLGMVLVLLEQQRAGAVRSARDAERLAYHDPLTGLPNRRLLREQLDAALASVRRVGGHVGVVFVDLDRFKVINDSLGHAAGDDLLRQAGTRLRGALRDTDTVARLGGDEFVLLLTALPDPAAAGTVAGKALDALRPPFSIAGHELFVTASAGVTVAPGDGQATETLVRQADMAMYQAKQSPAGALRFFSPDMNLAARARLETESALRRALARDELVLAYQPVVEVATGRVAGVEALVRWRHPERGLLPPSEFLEVAEATGLIVPMGAWVLRTACERARQWHEAGLGEPRLLVNLSVRQFLEPGLVDLVRGAVADAGLPPERLELEITESMAMADVAASEAVLRALNEAGVRLSIDDFGTGYSSFEYLRRFPIDTLKVDRGFVGGVETDPGDAAIVAAIIAMSHRLGLSVVGEGVETPGQLRFLRQQGCDAVQGYLIARPMLGDEMDDFLRRTAAHGALAGICAVEGQRGSAVPL